MASFNGEKYIKDQIESILSQLAPDDELVISDDQSTDATQSVVESFNDARIKLVRNPTPGLIQNFQNALIHAKGDYILLADQDDIWLAGKISQTVGALKSGAVLAVADCKIVNSDLSKTFEESFFQTVGTNTNFYRNIMKNTFMGCSMGFTRSVLEASLPFPDDIPMHDQWIALKALKMGEVKLIHKPLMLHRVHDSNASTTGKKSSHSLKQQIVWRANLLKRLYL